MLSFMSGVIFVFRHQICHEKQLTDGEKKAVKIKASFGNPFQKVVVLFIEKSVLRDTKRDAERFLKNYSVCVGLLFCDRKRPPGEDTGRVLSGN